MSILIAILIKIHDNMYLDYVAKGEDHFWDDIINVCLRAMWYNYLNNTKYK